MHVERLEDRLVAHANPVLDAEHAAVMALVPYEEVTVTASRSGNWSDGSIWSTGARPTAGAHVFIPEGVTVTLNNVQKAKIETLRVDGTLTWRNKSELHVSTVVVSTTGTWNMFAQDGSSQLMVFADTGAIDRAKDPKAFGRGFISHGKVDIEGVRKQWESTNSAKKGATQITLLTLPTNWRVGDQIVIAGTAVGQEEVRTITAISSKKITLNSALAYDHAPRAGYNVEIGNLTRNVVFKSENTKLDRRGHVMMMHEPTVVVAGAEFLDLGRTDKSKPLTNYRFAENGTVIGNPDPTGTNFAARYPLHFHRTGFEEGSAQVIDSVVENSPGWGMVNHSSKVDMTGNVVYNAYGAGYVTEAGDELGGFYNNLVVKTPGLNLNILDANRMELQDTGFIGSGFWLQGHNVVVTGNVSTGAAFSGYTVWGRALSQYGLGRTQVDREYLVDPNWAGAADHLDAQFVPLRLFKGNEAYAETFGMDTWFQTLGVTHGGRNVIDTLSAWNVSSGVTLTYTGATDVVGAKLYGAGPNVSTNGVFVNNVSRDVNIKDSTIVNFGFRGIQAPQRGPSTISNVFIDQCGAGITIDPLAASGTDFVRTLNITGVTFGANNTWNIKVGTKPAPKTYDTLGTITWNNKRLYYMEDLNTIPNAYTIDKVFAAVVNV